MRPSADTRPPRAEADAAGRDRPTLVAVSQPGVLEPSRHVLDVGRRLALWTFDVGLACCAVEFLAASLGGDDDVGEGER